MISCVVSIMRCIMRSAVTEYSRCTLDYLASCGCRPLQMRNAKCSAAEWSLEDSLCFHFSHLSLSGLHPGVNLEFRERCLAFQGMCRMRECKSCSTGFSRGAVNAMRLPVGKNCDAHVAPSPS